MLKKTSGCWQMVYLPLCKVGDIFRGGGYYMTVLLNPKSFWFSFSIPPFECWTFVQSARIVCFHFHFQFEIIIHTLVISPRFIWIPMLWAYGHYKFFFFYKISAGINFRRQNLKSKINLHTETVNATVDVKNGLFFFSLWSTTACNSIAFLYLKI